MIADEQLCLGALNDAHIQDFRHEPCKECENLTSCLFYSAVGRVFNNAGGGAYNYPRGAGGYNNGVGDEHYTAPAGMTRV